MQLGFVIDHSRCIGCHACTVACKSENDVPLGSFRTWVKNVEEGEFPDVKRSFAVLRCNQCTHAPCVTICPVSALAKDGRGIVDIDPKVCIGCKACMQGCPYDALYIHPGLGTAQKCHFCAHRVEVGLAPACAVVCPTEAIVPGDFDDPKSRVSRMRDAHGLAGRKLEAGTGPNVLYREVAHAAIDPLETTAAGGYLWAEPRRGEVMDAEVFRAAERRARARTVYDTEHPPPWGRRISGYLFAKSIASGAFLAGFLLFPPFRAASEVAPATRTLMPLLGLLALAWTGWLLVADLKKPSRFWYILARPNWSSWLARGTFVLAAYGLFLSIWMAVGLAGVVPGPLAGTFLGAPTGLAAALAAAYTGWLFGQAKGRALWMRRGLAAHLVVQALIAGGAVLLAFAPLADLGEGAAEVLRGATAAGLVLHAVFLALEGKAAPHGREREYEEAARLMTHGPYAARRFWGVLFVGLGVPLALLAVPWKGAWALAGLFALAGSWLEHDLLVRAGQALPIS